MLDVLCSIHGMLTFLADVYLLDPSGKSVWFFVTDASDQLITWFPRVVWLVRADLLCSIRLAVRLFSVKAGCALESTSVLCSYNLTPNFLFQRHMSYYHNWHMELYNVIKSVMSSLCCFSLGCTDMCLRVFLGFIAVVSLENSC